MAAVPSIGRATGVEALDAATSAAAHGLYERHYHRVLGFCRKRLRSHEEAEDAAQTTFYYAVGALQRGVVPVVEAAWLLKIAQNVCLNRSAANGRRARLEVASDPQVLQELAPAHDHSEGGLDALHDALASLTELQRRAIVLREWNGLSYREIAAELELTQSAVETLIFRARRSLARRLRGGRLRSGLDLGSLLAAAKSFLTGGGAAIKIAVGVAALAVGAGIAVPRVEHGVRHETKPPLSPRTPVAKSQPEPGVSTPVASTSRNDAAPGRSSAGKTAVTHAVVPIMRDRPVPAPSAGAAPTTGGPNANDAHPDAPPTGQSPARSPEPSESTSTPAAPSPAAGVPADSVPSQPVSVPTGPSTPALPETPQLPPVLPPAPPLPTDPVTDPVIDTTTSVVDDTTTAASNLIPKQP